MATSSHYFLTPAEFLAKACHQLELQLRTECPRYKILKTDVSNLSITIGESPNKGSHEERKGESENESKTVYETSGNGVREMSLTRVYRECFLENIFVAPTAENVDAKLRQFIGNSVASMVDKTAELTLIDIRKRILLYVKTSEWFDNFNEFIYTKLNSTDQKMVAFPMIGLPSTFISISIDSGRFRTNLITSKLQEWCTDPGSRALLERYAQKDDPQLGQLVEISEASKEEVGLLKLARENLAKKIEKRKNKTSIWEKNCTSCFVSKFSGEQEIDNLGASLILLPEEISKLKVKGDHVAVVPDTNTVIVGQSQDPFGLCYLGDYVLNTTHENRHVSAVPLRLVRCGKGLWKWITYRPDLSKNEGSVPRNRMEKDLIFSGFKKGSKTRDKQGRVLKLQVPVFIDFPAPLSFESQEEIAKLQDTPICNVNLRCMCWQCGRGSIENLRKCKQCLLARYCGPECQKEHWKMHKKFCKMRKTENANASQVKQGE